MHVAMTSLLVALPRTISSSRITLAGLKKCVPITISGRDVADAISSMLSVEVLLARMAPGLQILSSSREDLLLQRHAFEDRFDDHVGLLEAVVGERGRDQRHALVHQLLREAAALHGVFVILADGGHAAVERCLSVSFSSTGNAGIGEVHGDAAAHGACADHRRAIYWDRRRFFRDVGDLGHFALAEENVDQRLRLVGERHSMNSSRSVLAALIEG